MELYYKDLISEEASLEKLVDDLMRVVQGADELVQATGIHIAEEKRREIRTSLERLRERCARLKQQAMEGARATDKLLRQHPYFSVGLALACGFLAGAALCRKAGNKTGA